jgi:hypothetical protein
MPFTLFVASETGMFLGFGQSMRKKKNSGMPSLTNESLFLPACWAVAALAVASSLGGMRVALAAPSWNPAACAVSLLMRVFSCLLKWRRKLGQVWSVSSLSYQVSMACEWTPVLSNASSVRWMVVPSDIGSAPCAAMARTILMADSRWVRWGSRPW